MTVKRKGSHLKHKKYRHYKKPREQAFLIGSSKPLTGMYYDKDRMEFTELTTADGHKIMPMRSFSQVYYLGESGKERIINRIQDKVISNLGDLMRYVTSAFDKIFAIDTNTKHVQNEKISVSSIIEGVVSNLNDSNKYKITYMLNGIILFRNCPSEIPAEKFGWLKLIQIINSNKVNITRRFALVTDHDMDNHDHYNKKTLPILDNFYLPPNFTLIYARGDAEGKNFLNLFIKECEKRSSIVLKSILATGVFKHEGQEITIDQIPIPTFPNN